MKAFSIVCTLMIMPLFAITDVGGVIAENTVWGPTGNPPDSVYNLVGYIEIPDSVTLTIQPGVKIQSVTYGFWIYGRLIACGTTQEKILFTSASTTPNAGDWYGLQFNHVTTDSSYLTDCIIEYAEYGIIFGIYIVVRNALIHNCDEGISMVAGGTITNNEISNNTTVGIYIGGSPLIIGGNIIANNPVGIGIGNSDTLIEFLSPNYFSGNNQGIVILNGANINGAREWNPAVGGIDCWVDNCLNILPGGKFTIAPGNTFKFFGYSLVVDGRLIARGTPTEKITFTSAFPSPNPGDWDGISFGETAVDSSIMTNCVVEYGRGISTGYITPLKIQNTIIRRNDPVGVGTTGNITIENCEIYENGCGICFTSFYDAVIYIGNNVIRDNSLGLYIIESFVLPVFSSPNQFASNNINILIEGSGIHIKNNVEWNPAVGGVDCVVGSQLFIDSTGTFTIAPGNIFKLWDRIWIYGHLIARGTSASKITFTSASSNPAPGDWSDITFFRSASNTIMENCIIEYSYWGVGCYNDSMVMRDCDFRNSIFGIGIIGASGTISNCNIQNNQTGISIYGAKKSMSGDEKTRHFISDLIIDAPRDSMVSIDSNTITNNQTGIHCEYSGYPHIQFNNIYNNSDWGVYNADNDYWIYAEYNWWGDSTGPRDTSSIDTLYNPAGLGDRVSDHVDYQPWLTGPVFLEEYEKTNQFKTAKINFCKAVPNPFVNKTAVSFNLMNKDAITLKIYNIAGQIVYCNREFCWQPGISTISWDGKNNMGQNLPAGVYVVRIEAKDVFVMEKIIKLR